VHLNSILIKFQPDTTVCRYLFTAKLLYMFRVSQHPSSEVLKTVTAASGTGHIIGRTTSLQRGLIDICILLHLYEFLLTCLYMIRALYAHHQEVKIVLYSIWYRHTCRWPSGAHRTATYRCDDTRRCIIQF